MIRVSNKDRIFDTLRDTQRVYLTMKISFKLRTDVQSKDGSAPIYLHASAGGKRERVNLDLRVKPVNWVPDKERARPIDKEHQDLNLMLDNISSKLANIRTLYRLSEAILTAKTLKTELKNDMPRVNFVSFMTQRIEEEKVLMKPGTFRRYNAVVNKLRAYSNEILFNEVTEDFFRKYRIYLKKLGNVDTTVNANIKAIKKYLKVAVRAGIKIPVDLDDIKGGSTSGNRNSLTPDEVKILLNHYYKGTLDDWHRLTLGYFLFSCVTGLRISDMQNLDRKQLVSEIAFTSVKTMRNQIINLNKTAVDILMRCPDLFVTHIHRNSINRSVQDIAKQLEINKGISLHVGRHTFATSFLRAGGKVEQLQPLLGHTKIDTTMIYVHILEAEANKQIFLLDDLFN